MRQPEGGMPCRIHTEGRCVKQLIWRLERVACGDRERSCTMGWRGEMTMQDVGSAAALERID